MGKAKPAYSANQQRAELLKPGRQQHALTNRAFRAGITENAVRANRFVRRYITGALLLPRLWQNPGIGMAPAEGKEPGRSGCSVSVPQNAVGLFNAFLLRVKG